MKTLEKYVDIECLPYLEFCKLSDSKIIGSNPSALLQNVLKTKDDRNYKLYTIIVNYIGDSKQINNFKFDIKYNRLRKDKNPEKIFKEYPKLVSEFCRY